MHRLLLETEATLMFQQMTYIDAYINIISVTCSPHNAKLTIGRYQHTNWLIPIVGKTADNQLIPSVGRLSMHLYTVSQKELSRFVFVRTSSNFQQF